MFDKLIKPVSDIVGKFVKDKDLQAQLDHELKTLFHQANLAQVEINKLEAKGNWFQSSWRPLTGYVCVAGLAINFLISPIAKGFGIDIPQADAGVMMPLLTGMLGIAGMRSYDKLKKNRFKIILTNAYGGKKKASEKWQWRGFLCPLYPILDNNDSNVCFIYSNIRTTL